MTAPEHDGPLARAKGYPYRAPRHSYVFVNGVDYPIVRFDGDPVRDGELRVDGEALPVAGALRRLGVRDAAGLDERVPVIAHGSNASPERLARKFADVGDDVVIPVMRAWLADYDVVYAAHFTGYGAIPSTLEASPGTTAQIAVTWLTADQLALMHTTEIAAVNYVYGRLGGLNLECDGLPRLDAAYVYLTLHGCAMLTGAPMALAAVGAHRRRFEAASMPAMLALARDRLAPDMGLDDFIMETIADSDLRRARTDALRRTTRRPSFPGFEVIEA